MSELWQMQASEIAALVKARKISAVDAAQSALARLEAVNPAINAVVEEFPKEALDMAKAVDEAIGRGEDPGILAGVPVTIKVNVDQKGHATTNGLRIQKDLIADQDNPVVANLRNQGAVFIGRTNTPAFSLHWFTRNSLHGHTLNPHNQGLTPGGSSGGAASATAAGIGAIGHGSDIGGSIRYPAYACGIHGLRPSLGRVPAANFSAPDRFIGGQIMAVSGPLARTIADIRLGFNAMAGRHVGDPWSAPVPLELPQQPKRCALTIEPDGLKVDAPVKDALRDAAKRLEAAGWQVEEVDCPSLREPAHQQAILWLAEFRRTGAAAVVEEGDPDAKFIYAQMARLCPEPDLNAFMDALQVRLTLARTWHKFFEKYPVLLCPVSGEAPFPDLLDLESPESFDRVMEAQLTQVGIPLMGLPGLAVATGILEGNIPMGVQLIAGGFREDTLLAAGAAIEAAGPLITPVDPQT